MAYALGLPVAEVKTIYRYKSLGCLIVGWIITGWHGACMYPVIPGAVSGYLKGLKHEYLFSQAGKQPGSVWFDYLNISHSGGVRYRSENARCR